MKKRTVLGLDILPSRDAFYAVVIDENGFKIWEGTVTKSELPKLVSRFKVHKIGIDNVFELAPSNEELAELLRKLRIKVVQVTGHPSKARKLNQIAAELGLWRGGKLSPKEAAEIAAILALRNFGAEVSVFDDVTEIIISRTRSLGEGGQHQTKYARVMASLIHSVLSEVEDKLKEKGFPYDVVKHEGDFGVKSARIIVYAPYKAVRNLVGEYYGSLIRVEIRPLERKRLAFLSPAKDEPTHRYIICGIDPGETIGVALMDLKGRVIAVTSKKFFALSELIEYIYSYGKPIVLATDVPKRPQLIEYLASKTGALIFAPSTVLSVGQKNEIVRELGISVANTHERDALVAALLAFNKYKGLLQKVDSVLSYIPLKLDAEEIKKEVILGASVKEAIRKQFWIALRSLISSDSAEKKAIRTPRESELAERISELSARLSRAYIKIERLQSRIEELEADLWERDREIERLQTTIARLKREKDKLTEEELKRREGAHIRRLLDELSCLRGKLTSYKKRVELLERVNEALKKIIGKSSDELVVKIVEELNLDEISRLEDFYGPLMPHDVILVKSASRISEKAIEKLSSASIRALILPEDVPEAIIGKITESLDIAFLEDFVEACKVELKDDIFIVKEDCLERALRHTRRRFMDDVEAAYDELEEVLEDWRKRRVKTLTS